MTTTTEPEPMRMDERADSYTRRTGRFPPHWSADRCRIQDQRLDAARRAGDLDTLRRWGVL